MSKSSGKASASAINLLNELKKLKSQQKYLEAMQMSLQPITETIDESRQLNEIEKLKIVQELNWKQFKEKIINDVEHVKNVLNDFKRNMMNEEAIKNHTVKEYRERIQEIDTILCQYEEQNINDLKHLKAEYCEISDTLASINTTNLLINSPLSVRCMINDSMRAINVRKALSAPVNRAQCNDVRQFDKFLNDHNGHTGGWQDEEHHIFIKMKIKYKKNIEQICDALKAILIGLFCYSIGYISRKKIK